MCIVFALTLNLALAAGGPAATEGSAKAVPGTAQAAVPKAAEQTPKAAQTPAATPPVVDTVAVPVDSAAIDSAQAAGAAAKIPPAPADTAKVVVPGEGEQVLEGRPSTAQPDAAATPAPPAVLAAPAKSSRPIISDWSLAARQYLFGAAGQAVAGALGFYIGSAIETAIVGEEDAHQGTLSFTGIRYDVGYGAFWGGSIGSLFGSSLTVYFTGQSDEENGSYFWTTVGTGLAGAGAIAIASAMGVEEEVDWPPFIPLLALPSAGGVLGFQLSRWFNDGKREKVMGPDAGLQLHPPRLAWIPERDGSRFQLQALNLTF